MSEDKPTPPARKKPAAEKVKPVWVVMQTGLSMNKDTGREDRRGRPVKQVVTLDPNQPYVLSEKYAAGLFQKGYCRRATGADFPNGELPEAKPEDVIA